MLLVILSTMSILEGKNNTARLLYSKRRAGCNDMSIPEGMKSYRKLEQERMEAYKVRQVYFNKGRFGNEQEIYSLSKRKLPLFMILMLHFQHFR